MIELLIPLFIKVRFFDIVDIFLVAMLMYQLYKIVRGTPAIHILVGIIAVFIVWRLVRALNMELLGEILGAFISVGFIALIVVFQPEIRKFLLMLGTPGFMKQNTSRLIFWKPRNMKVENMNTTPIIQACHKMAQQRTGALIVFTHNHELADAIETGIRIEGLVSESLLLNIFYKNSPMHDGAVIIRNNRVIAASAILPVSVNESLPSSVGLRHRAAVGVTEKTDAVAVIVSEQTGNISWSKGGQLIMDITPARLKSLLDDEFNSI